MTIGLPIALSLQDSNVVDPAQTLESLMMNGQAPIFSQGLELQDGDWVFEYNGVEFTPKIWNQTSADAGEYNLDEVLLRDKKLVKVTGKNGDDVTMNQRPFEPEEYSTGTGEFDGFDTTMDSANWSQRYVKVSHASVQGWLNKTWLSPTGKRWYYMFWENRGYGGCGTGAWRWSAKDLNANIGERDISWYLRSCLLLNYSTKFDFAKDIQATAPYWGSTECSGGCPKEDTVQFQSMIERGGYFYYRTNVNVAVKYATWETGVYDYSYMNVISPSDIDGFILKRRTNANNPFDGKGYTKAIVDTTATGYKATWTCLASSPFDSIAFGKVICDSIDVVFKTVDGVVIEALNRFMVDNSIAKGTHREYETTKILYAGELLDSETIIEVTLHGSQVSIGKMIASDKLDAGFTNFEFANEMLDLTPKEQDQWGNWEYAEGGMKLRKLKATVEFPIVDYDGLERMMLMIGGGEVVIDGSDATNNEVPDGRKVFSATQMIARIISLKLQPNQKNKRIGDIGKYDITIEEMV